jgi:hypothetical protein
MARKPMPSPDMTVRSIRNERGRRLRRFVLAALGAAIVAAAMSGCALIKSNSSSQLNTIGKVQITTVICAGDTNSNNAGFVPADSACQGSTKGGNIGGDAANGSYQISLAYRISSASTAPASFTSTNTSSPPTTPCGSGVTFNQNAGLASAIEALSPAGSGKKWVAYYSTTQTYSTAGCQYLTVSPQFTLNQAFAVVAFQGPYTYRPIVGWRQVNDSVTGDSSSRAATCGSSLTSSYADGVDNDSNGSVDETGICADDPPAATIATDLSQNTRDLGVLPTVSGSAHAGGSGTVTFNANYKGAALPSGTFNLTATTTVPGGTATPSQSTLTPQADSDNNVNVTVTVPANTTPGSYTVQLIATLSTDPTQTRGGTVGATLTVGNAFDFDPVPDVPDLPGLTLNGHSQTTTKQMNNFGVNDTSASPSGWNVTVIGDSGTNKSPVFKQYCTQTTCGSDPAGYVSGGRTLAANSLTLNSTGSNWTGGTGSAPTFPCNSGCFVDHATATKIASAASGQGTGLWSTNFGATSLSLATPTTLRILPTNEQYHADLVWSLNSGP